MAKTMKIAALAVTAFIVGAQVWAEDSLESAAAGAKLSMPSVPQLQVQTGKAPAAPPVVQSFEIKAFGQSLDKEGPLTFNMSGFYRMVSDLCKENADLCVPGGDMTKGTWAESMKLAGMSGSQKWTALRVGRSQTQGVLGTIQDLCRQSQVNCQILYSKGILHSDFIVVTQGVPAKVQAWNKDMGDYALGLEALAEGGD